MRSAGFILYRPGNAAEIARQLARPADLAAILAHLRETAAPRPEAPDPLTAAQPIPIENQ